MYKKYMIQILSLFLAIQGWAGDESEESSSDTPLNPVQYSKVCPYGAFSLSTGGGVSWRNRNNSKGTAIDLKAGTGYIPSFFSYGPPFLSISGDYNWCYYFASSESSPYCSLGVGASVVLEENLKRVLPLPYAPLRLGYQFPYGFIDIGAKMLLLWVPIPEARAGISFEF